MTEMLCARCFALLSQGVNSSVLSMSTVGTAHTAAILFGRGRLLWISPSGCFSDFLGGMTSSSGFSGSGGGVVRPEEFESCLWWYDSMLKAEMMNIEIPIMLRSTIGLTRTCIDCYTLHDRAEVRYNASGLRLLSLTVRRIN